MFLGGFIEFQTAQDLRQFKFWKGFTNWDIVKDISAIGIEDIDA